MSFDMSTQLIVIDPVSFIINFEQILLLALLFLMLTLN